MPAANRLAPRIGRDQVGAHFRHLHLHGRRVHRCDGGVMELRHDRRDEVVTVVRETVRAKLEVANPRYLEEA